MKRTTLILDREDHRMLTRLCKLEKLSMNGVLRRLIRQAHVLRDAPKPRLATAPEDTGQEAKRQATDRLPMVG